MQLRFFPMIYINYLEMEFKLRGFTTLQTGIISEYYKKKKKSTLKAKTKINMKKIIKYI